VRVKIYKERARWKCLEKETRRIQRSRDDGLEWIEEETASVYFSTRFARLRRRRDIREAFKMLFTLFGMFLYRN
jgi:hypothetical protein